MERNVKYLLLRKTIILKTSIFLRHGFVDERAMVKTTLMSSCHWKTFVPFCLRKKRPENVL